MDLSVLLPNFTIIELILYVAILVPTAYTMIGSAPFVPTQMPQVDRMLKAVPLKPGMKLYDLGSGDGRLVHKAAKEYKVDAVGYEFSPIIWLWAKFLSIFWRTKAKLKYGNFWHKDLSDADVIVCYLLPKAMKRMHKEIFPKLKSGTYIVSHAFSLPGHEPLKKLPKIEAQRIGSVWVYRKP